jgi:hypothetical protein
LVTVTDPKEIARLDAILLPFSQNAHWYTDHFEGIETTPKYKGRYVVVVNQKIVGYGKNLPRLRVRLIARGVNMRSAYAEFVNFKRGTEILSKAA